jgi:hypothetical protein
MTLREAISSRGKQMRIPRIALSAALVAFSFGAAPAGATLITIGNTFGTDAQAGICTPCYYALDSRASQSFALSDPTTITSVEARLDIDPPTYLGGIQFSISGLNTSFSQILNDLSGLASAGSDYRYDVNLGIGQLNLEPGDYVLSIVGLFAGDPNDPNNILGWVESPQGGFSFRVNGDTVSVPEPNTLYLLGAGLLGVALFRRRSIKAR